jgi:hypothetical protein
MSNFTKKDFEKLIAERDNICVSIYIPTDSYGSETQQAPIRLKNLLREVENQLKGIGWKPTDVDQLLDPIQKLIDKHLFWEHQDDGLALFRSPDEWITYKLPFDITQTAVVSNRFHLKPLLSLIRSNDRFYVLALSLGLVRLFLGNRYQVAEIEVPELPQGIEEALKYDDPERQLQHQTLSRTGGGHPAIHHGHGDAYDPKENALRYFRIVAESVQEVLKDDQAPLLLAGLDYQLPIYREANTYPFLYKDDLPGNPEEESVQTLYQKAWDILQPVFSQQQKDAIAIYQRFQSSNPNQVSTNLRKIVPAAYYGRVDTIFVALGIQKWGIFIPDANTIELHTKSTPENEDLLDLAVINTFLNGGDVYPIDPDRVPGKSEIAAIFRY